MNNFTERDSLDSLVDAHVFGAKNDWEKHELGEKKSFEKPLAVRDPALKARVAERFAEMGFVPHMFKESGQEFIALESMKQTTGYQDIVQAFKDQILSRL